MIHSRVTSTNEYHYKGHEPYEQLLHTAYTRFDTLPPPLDILLPKVIRQPTGICIPIMLVIIQYYVVEAGAHLVEAYFLCQWTTVLQTMVSEIDSFC